MNDNLPVPPPLDLSFVKYAVWTILAMCGGAVKFVSASLKSHDTMSPRRFFVLLSANVFISGFSGLMGALLFSTISENHVWQLIAAGIFGYLGTQGIDIVTLVMNKKMTNVASPVSSVLPIPVSVDPGAPAKVESARVQA